MQVEREAFLGSREQVTFAELGKMAYFLEDAALEAHGIAIVGVGNEEFESLMKMLHAADYSHREVVGERLKALRGGKG